MIINFPVLCRHHDLKITEAENSFLVTCSDIFRLRDQNTQI